MEMDSKENASQTYANPLTDEFILTMDKIGAAIEFESCDKKLDPDEDLVKAKSSRQLVTDTEGNELGQNLTLLHVTSLAIGQIIGSGIFISPNEVVKQVGSPGLSIIVWLLGGLLSLCGALAFGELGAMYPKSGGEYQYLKLTYGRLMGFVNLWVSVIRNSLSIAVIALTFSTYFISMFMEPDQPQFELIKKCVAAGAIAVIIVLCLASTKYSLYVVNTFTVLKIGALFMIIVLGVATLCQGNFENIKPGFEGTNMDVGLWSNALMSSLWAYNGWNCVGIIASEVKNPKKNLPRALIITGLVMTVLYVVTNISYHILLSPEDLVARESIAIVVGETFFGQWGSGAAMFGKYFFAISVAFSTFGALVSVILAWSRLPFAAAQDEMFPSCFSLVLKQSKTPVVSLLFTGMCAFICVWPSNIFSLITYVGFLSWLFWGLCFAGVIVLRWKYPDIERPFRVPLAVPVIAVICSLYLVIGLFYAMPVSSGVCVACSLIAIPVYYGYVDTDKSCSQWMENLTDKLKHHLNAE